MPKRVRTNAGLTLVELLVVIAIIAVLAALLFPAVKSVPDKSRLTACMNNLKQINLGVQLYADDSNDTPPGHGTNMLSLFSAYKELMKKYVGLNGTSSPADKLFACPVDAFYPSYMTVTSSPPYHYVHASLHNQPFFDYSSYAFNGGDNQARPSDVGPWTPPGLTGLKLSSVKHPARTVLVAEAAALVPWSWHRPLPTQNALPYNDAKDVVSFVDGHVSYIPIYWNSTRYPNNGISFAFTHDPPNDYDYQWSGN